MIAKDIVTSLAVTGLEGTALALVAFAICRGRVRPAWQAAVWLVVLAKFVLPWTPAMPWSLDDLFASARSTEAPVATTVGPVHEAAAHVSILWTVLLAAWAVGTATSLTLAIVRHRRAVAAARAAWLAPEDARAELARLAKRVGVRAPALHVGDDTVGPHVVGMFQPIIVVPAALLRDLPMLRAALLHELAHVRRRDGFGRAIQVVAQSLYFFWPVVRLIGRRLDLAREAACDAWALEASEMPRPAYARLLLDMARLRVATGELAMGAHHLDARVTAVLGDPVRARLGVRGKLAVAAFTVVALGGARSARAHGEHPSCVYTSEMATALFAAHPEADLDGDGTLSRDEACELQAELRRYQPENVSQSEPEPLYCNRDSEVGQIPAESTCHQGD